MPDFTTYQPPGVYIEEDTSSLVSVIGVRPTVVALVGPSVGYRTHTEAVTLDGTTAVTLAKLGINTTTGFSVSLLDGTAVANTEYTITAGAGADANISTTIDNTTTLARTGGSTIPTGSVVYVTYRYTDAAYYEPLRVRDFDDAKDGFGEPLNLDTGAIISPLTMAAKLAFENGARELVLVASNSASSTAVTRTEMSTALLKLNTVYDVNVVVPITVGMTGTSGSPGDLYNLGLDLRSHVETASAEGNYRIGIIGYDTGAVIDPATALGNFRSKRVMLAWPNKLHYYNGYANQTLEVGGQYLAAAYAGRLASNVVQEPLTMKQIAGFSGLPASVASGLTVAQKNTWSDAGVAVAEVTRDGRLRVRHGVTTDRTNIQTRELSLVRAKDALVNLLQETFDSAGLVGSYIDDDTPIRIKGVAQGVLETAVQSEVIIAYNDLKVRKLTSDPSIIEVKFQYRPAYPLNYIVISFSINTTTGETTLDQLAA